MKNRIFFVNAGFAQSYRFRYLDKYSQVTTTTRTTVGRSTQWTTTTGTTKRTAKP